MYHRPRDPACPLVCLDETSKQLIKETRVPIPAKPGRPARTDYEYERNGTANIFMLFAPLEGWRHAKVTDRHAAVDYAHLLRDVSDRWFPNAAKIALVQDNLSTHKPASLYEAFPLAHRAKSAMPSVKEMDGSPSRGTFRMALHPEAWQLAQHGRNRTQRVVITMPGPTYFLEAGADRRSRRLGSRQEQESREGRLAVHHRRRAGEIEAALPVTMTDSRH